MRLPNKGSVIVSDKKICLDDVVGCLLYKGKAKTLDDMERAITTGAHKIKVELKKFVA